MIKFLSQGLDDMESDLFGGSLGKTAIPSKSSKPTKPSSETKDKAKAESKPPNTEDSAKSANNTRPKSISPEPTKPTSAPKGTQLHVRLIVTLITICWFASHCILSAE